MSVPPVIYLDPRVLASMKTEPDPDAAVEPVPYYSNEYARALADAARGGAEFFIQVCEIKETGVGKFVGLTNMGRIYHYSFATKAWSHELELPDFDEAPVA